MNSTMSRVIDIQDHHLRRAPCFSAALDHARKGIEAFHEAHRAGRDSAAAKRSLLPRSVEKFVPVPEPHLKSIPSVRVSPMIDSMLSLTELMKHAEHCGFGCTPTLNHTGELKAIFCSTSRCHQLVAERIPRLRIWQIPALSAPSHDGITTRPINCRTDPFALGRPGLSVEILAGGRCLSPSVTSSWAPQRLPGEDRHALLVSNQRRALLPFDRVEGDFFPSVKYRWKLRPFPAPRAGFSAAVSVAGEFPLNACFTVAIRPSALSGPHSRGENPFILLLCVPPEVPRFASGSGLEANAL